MSAPEVVARARDQAARAAWLIRRVRPGAATQALPPGGPRPAPAVPAATVAAVPSRAVEELVAAAERLLSGSWEFLGVERDDLVAPDWFLDPVTGRRAPQDRHAFRVDHRSQANTGDVKQVWELSRHHHLTVLAAAWFVSGDVRYAERVDHHLRSWWRENPFLSGIHWTSGIELGIRLIAWAWVRRLLDDWEGVGDLFESNDLAAWQIRWHQEYLATFTSTGSSANNHAIAETAGQLVASCAFPWFAESDRWRRRAAADLEHHLARNTFPSGVNRELASGYHAFVAELGLVAAVEAEVSGHPLSGATWDRLGRMVDAAAAMVDATGRAPRQGDSDDGRALVVDGPDRGGWSSLLAAGAALFGPLPWWPTTEADLRSTLFAALANGPRQLGERPMQRPSNFADAGLTLLRSPRTDGPEIWCRCDGGPHGHLSIAAHAHADALAIEVRHGGVDVLADPGTYCYHTEPEWRSYFRSTLGHNSLELAGQDQSEPGGPFLWVTHATSRLRNEEARGHDMQSWEAEHDGYRQLEPSAVHRRRVRLDDERRRLEVVDWVAATGRHPCRLAFHLGPSVAAALDHAVAHLEWPGAQGPASAILQLPNQLRWSLHRGETDPILGWYSPGFGRKQPATTVVGVGSLGSSDGAVTTVLQFGL